VVGSKKMAVYNDLSADERIRIFDKGLAEPALGNVHDVPLSYRYGDIRSPYLEFEEPLLVQDREFAKAILTRRLPRTDAENGLTVVQTLEAAEIALREGRTVAIDPVGEMSSIEEALAAVS
jgi:predicted dehydrogenase